MFGTVNNKIRWGTAFLFLLVVLAGGTGVYYLVSLRLQSKDILRDNYESLQYAHGMQRSLDSILANKPAYLDSFAAGLRLQEANVTERGETEATAALRRAFDQLAAGEIAAAHQVRKQLQQVLQLNMKAIQGKYAASESAADRAVTIIIAVISLILLVGFTFGFNFPSVITTPIQRLTEAIRAIGARNYAHRIHMESRDEFGALANAFNEMAERLEYFENSNLNKILFEKKRAEAVINSLQDASIGIDATGRILFANDQALQLLGLAAPEIVGLAASEVGQRIDLFRFLLEDSGTAPFKVVVNSKENYFVKERIEVGDVPERSQVIVLKNITSFKELDVAKTNFIATISHELKTPLAASDFSLRLLEDARVGQLTNEQQELVQSLKADNRRMLRILSELLNLTQVEAGRIQLRLQDVVPAEIVAASVQAVDAAAKEKGVRISNRVPANLPRVAADADKAVWVLNNFLTNAIKFAPARSEIDVAVEGLEDQVLFAVTDRGPGIDAQYLPNLFDRYFQVPGHAGNGSGIGLSICKELIEAMGGTVSVESGIGLGSTFKFSLGNVAGRNKEG